MYKPSKKTIYITSAFAAVAGIVGVSSYWNDIAYAVCDKSTRKQMMGKFD